jgi:DNA-directed RNA polymerase II subunit RPB2
MTIIEKQNTPLVNKYKSSGKQQDKWVDYKGAVHCCTVVGDGIVYVRRNKTPIWCGNSRHGQKGTCGILLKGTDMMHTGRGITPDIILNPNAIPSRMTIGQLIECLIGKVATLKCEEADGTPFEDRNIEAIKDELKALGYRHDCTEYMYNGMTGEMMNIPIFIGPTYYNRLKHMVQDKVHARARGPRTLLTRQAPEGRSRDGGLRVGEMERDAITAHGLARLLKEKLMDNSDAYSTYVCGKCGLFAQRANRRNNKKYPQDTDIYFCQQCNNYNDIHKVMIPYAFKLMLQELMSMCIAPRIRIEKPVFDYNS